jgi:hypothetical protein
MASSPRIVLLFASACLQTVAAWPVMADRRRLAAAPKPMEHAIEDQLDKKCPIQVQCLFYDPWLPVAFQAAISISIML